VKEEQGATDVLNEVLAMKLQLMSYLEMTETEERYSSRLNEQTNPQPHQFEAFKTLCQHPET